MEYQHLSADELKSQIEQTKQREAELQRALEERWQEEKSELAQEIRAIIEDRGHEVDDVVNLLVSPSRRRGSRSSTKKSGTGNYTRYVDPADSHNVYTRGVLPGWMKEKMAAAGLDPSVKADRETFKSNHLKAVRD